MVRTAGAVSASYALPLCIRCRICDSVCPSGRNGGIHPYSIIFALLAADSMSGTYELKADVWKCLMCHRCTTACPEDIDVTGAIRALRYDSILSGEAPKRFRIASDALVKHARAFPINDSVNKKREELGLNRIEEDEKTLNDIKMIMSRTGFHYE